jgi:hypothetical protein
MVVCTLWGTLRKAIRYLLWIWRETHEEKLIGLVGNNTPCIKLRVTLCVWSTQRIMQGNLRSSRNSNGRRP